MYNSKIRHIELPENLFSNLGELKTKTVSTKEKSFSLPTEDISKENKIKLTNLSQKKEYRSRIDKMYEEVKDIEPIDHEIDNVLYFNNYTEKGIVIKPKITSLKQFWTEYRLIKNEKVSPKTLSSEKNINDFDKLFDALQSRVTEINKYIDELKEMRINIKNSSDELEKDKQKLSSDKQEFLNYKKTEETKIKKEKENLKINFDRLQTIIDDLNQKLENIDQ